MTDEIKNKMIEEINGWIKLAYEDYKANGRTVWYNRTIDRINGMVKMLSIATSSRWVYDEHGVYERKVTV